jgi:amphi-Trp domain-containing protein
MTRRYEKRPRKTETQVPREEELTMGKEQILFKSEEKMSPRQAAELLRTIADKLESGTVTLARGDKETVLKIPDRVEVELKAEKETGRSKTTKKLEIEIEWLIGASAKSKGPVTIK